MITSIQNQKVKKWAELLTRKGRERYGQFLIEGTRLVEDALLSGAKIEALLWQTGKHFPLLQSIPPDIEVWEVSEPVIKKVTDTENPQGIVAVVAMTKDSLPDQLEEEALYLLVDGVQDPGNLGTIIRTADAAGVNRVILGKGTVDVYNPKTVRSTMASIFNLPIVMVPLEEAIPYLQRLGMNIYGSALETDNSIYDVDFGPKTGIIVGNEGEGISEHILAQVNQKVRIPIYGKAESLNVAIATGLLLYEAKRQRV